MDLGSTQRIAHENGWAHVIELATLQVTVIEGPDLDLSVEIPVSLVRVGSAPENDLVLTDRAISRRHMTIERTAAGLRVSDLGSTNGTFIEGVRVQEGFIEPGGTLRVGNTTLKVAVQAARRIAVPAPGADVAGMIGDSPAMRELYALVRAVARSPVTVLVEGETGTGKELVARAIHDASQRAGELVVFDCASVSGELIQSELFGHKGGAFTGATDPRSGACRLAHRGTLFIDEIGELPLALQPAFLRFLERREVKALGTDRPVPVDTRVISATHVDLGEAVAGKRFREDLYHRLKVVKIRIPPLREREGDVSLLIDHFLSTSGAEIELDGGIRSILEEHPWPGNVRELKHTLERLAVTCHGRKVKEKDLQLESVPGEKPVPRAAPEALTVERIRKALEETGGNKAHAAKLLGIGRSTFFRKLRELGFDTGSDSGEE